MTQMSHPDELFRDGLSMRDGDNGKAARSNWGMHRPVTVAGVGMTTFADPGTEAGDRPDWAKEAMGCALAGAHPPRDEAEHVSVGDVDGDSAAARRAAPALSVSDVPVVDVETEPIDRYVGLGPAAVVTVYRRGASA